MTGLSIAVGTLVAGALGLLAWEARAGRRAQRAARWVTLAALLIACACTALPATQGSTLPALRALLPDELSRLLRGVFLLGMALRLALAPGLARADRDAEQAPAHDALHLLSAAGAALALSTSDLLLVALGVMLFAAARPPSPHADAFDASRVRLLGVGALCFGVSLLYAGTATLDLGVMSQYLWEHPGPQAALLYAGVGLTLAGLALLSGLLHPLPASAPREATDAVLGMGVLLRLALGGLGALQYVWGWLVAGAGLAAMLAGWLRARRRPGLERVGALDAAQRGLLLLTLAFAHTAGGLQAALMATVAYWLAEAVTTAVARRLAADAPARADATGLLARNPCLAVALLLGLLSLASTPLTLGFSGRAALLWAAPDAPRLALALAALVLSALCAAEYLPLVLRVVRAPASDAPLRVPAYVCTLLLVAAVALLALGVFPQSFAAWVTLIAP
ncbi:MAG: hypothetical protein GX557_07120 [Chloroflexi bacterium]|nr:hypothetical protein [Chloroflexota bacterium]